MHALLTPSLSRRLSINVIPPREDHDSAYMLITCLTAQRTFADHCPRVGLHGPTPCSRGINSWGLMMSVRFLVHSYWAQARACAGTTGLPERAKWPVTSECHNRSQITDPRRKEKERKREKEKDIKGTKRGKEKKRESEEREERGRERGEEIKKHRM